MDAKALGARGTTREECVALEAPRVKAGAGQFPADFRAEAAHDAQQDAFAGEDGKGAPSDRVPRGRDFLGLLQDSREISGGLQGGIGREVFLQLGKRAPDLPAFAFAPQFIVELDPGMPSLGTDPADSAQKGFDFVAVLDFPIHRQAFPVANVHARQQIGDFDRLRCAAPGQHRRKRFGPRQIQSQPVRFGPDVAPSPRQEVAGPTWTRGFAAEQFHCLRCTPIDSLADQVAVKLSRAAALHHVAMRLGAIFLRHYSLCLLYSLRRILAPESYALLICYISFLDLTYRRPARYASRRNPGRPADSRD